VSVPQTVFYSWQSDLPSKTNRGLIEFALERALAAIGKNAQIDRAPRLDQDTSGVPGSPDIGATILGKIDAASAFVADVSVVSGAEGRPSPNPNVLIELGYALKSLAPSRVIMVFNVQCASSQPSILRKPLDCLGLPSRAPPIAAPADNE
jgi:hypothetical protein